MSKDEQAPQSLGELNINYTSDTDEPFEPVALKWKRGDLNADSLSETIGHHSAAEEISLSKFSKDYRQVVEAVQEHVADGKAGIKAFRLGGDGARCEYWIVGLDGDGRLVGVRARAVES